MDYSAMTVNERLFDSGLMNKFEKAIQNHNRNLMIEILKKIQLDEKQAKETVDRLLENPKFYGYK